MATTDAVDARKRGDLQTLLDLLADTDQLTRSAAAQQLGILGDPAAVEPLVRTLHASDDGLRVSAVNALAKIGGPAVIPTLLETARDDPASGVRVTAIDALARLGDPQRVEMLARLALDPLPLVETSLRWFKPVLIFGSRRNELRQTRRWALQRLRELHAVEALSALENAPQPRSPLLRLRLRRTVKALQRRQN